MERCRRAGQSIRKNLRSCCKKAHETGKPIRFWGAPDNAHAWNFFKKLGVDYINTDHIEELAGFLQ
ncbi:hypothetical protein [Niabella ginsengisoli]|uniref:Uncharacterized protein n=1 Tax=Niabella ginsengisoli TaxID=522298 RepID=A0ABS9SFM9_9BACT|nr:hypothetical protein [Niabella ginsengisoli]MCH5597166.1 hypothetical protein [Niabella ginsengisoli]